MFETLSRAVAGRAGIIAEVTLSYIAFETWSGKPEPGIFKIFKIWLIHMCVYYIHRGLPCSLDLFWPFIIQIRNRTI